LHTNEPALAGKKKKDKIVHESHTTDAYPGFHLNYSPWLGCQSTTGLNSPALCFPISFFMHHGGEKGHGEFSC